MKGESGIKCETTVVGNIIVKTELVPVDDNEEIVTVAKEESSNREIVSNDDSSKDDNVTDDIERSSYTSNKRTLRLGTRDSPRIKFCFTSGSTQQGTQNGSMQDLAKMPVFMFGEHVTCKLCGTEVDSGERLVEHWKWEMMWNNTKK